MDGRSFVPIDQEVGRGIAGSRDAETGRIEFAPAAGRSERPRFVPRLREQHAAFQLERFAQRNNGMNVKRGVGRSHIARGSAPDRPQRGIGG